MSSKETVCVALWEDRHSDTSAHVFKDRNKAIEWARHQCKHFARSFDNYEEHDITPSMAKQGCIFHGNYSCEGDGITVMLVEVQ